MVKKVVCISLVAILLTLAGCKQDGDNTKLSPFLYDYTPVNVGHSVIYDVDSIRYNFILGSTQQIDTIYYQIKEAIQDTFYDNLGRLNQTIYVYKRYDTTQPFIMVDRAWYCVQTRNTFEQVEDDFRYVKFTFPPVAGNQWPGNEYLPASDTVPDVFQPFAGWIYSFTSVNKPTIVNNLHFDSTAVVTEINTQNLINNQLSRETYARHIGLIYKEWDLINKQSVISTWDAPDSANGFRIRMMIHSYTP